MQDKFHDLVANATLPVFVMGNPTTSEFTLVSLGGPDDAVRAAAAKGMTAFVGVIGIVDDKPRVALNEPLDDETVAKLSAAYVAAVTQVADAAEVHLLQALYALPDTRPN